MDDIPETSSKLSLSPSPSPPPTATKKKKNKKTGASSPVSDLEMAIDLHQINSNSSNLSMDGEEREGNENENPKEKEAEKRYSNMSQVLSITGRQRSFSQKKYNKQSVSWMEIPSELPKSSILKKSNENIYKAMKELFDKYVSTKEASFEINVSWETRKFLREYFELPEVSQKLRDIKEIEEASQSLIANSRDGNENFNKYEALCIFDACCNEVFRLLLDSFSRFRRTQAFKQLCEELAREP